MVCLSHSPRKDYPNRRGVHGLIFILQVYFPKSHFVLYSSMPRTINSRCLKVQEKSLIFFGLVLQYTNVFYSLESPGTLLYCVVRTLWRETSCW